MTTANVADVTERTARTDVPALSFRDVDLRLRNPAGAEHQILQGLSLDVAEGEFCVVVGASGCGKSTLLNLAAGLLKPTSGEVLQRGKRIVGTNTAVGYATQSANLMPWLTVRENLMLPLQVRKTPKSERKDRVEHWIETVGLAGYGDHYPHELSGGMQKRCSIARTLVYDPDIILLDEPFGALDAMTKVVMQDELLKIWQAAGKTVVFITHDLTEAVALADRVVAMGKFPGRIKEVIEVGLPRPRDVFRLMDDPRAVEMHDHLWGLMRDQISEGGH